MDQLSNLARGVRPSTTPDTTPSPAKLGKKRSSRFEVSPPSVKIVLSLREDFLAELDELSNRIPGLLDERFRLVPLSRTAAARALQEPAKVEDRQLASGTFEFDPKTIEQILNFLEQRASLSTKRSSSIVEPFQLQLICQRLEKISAEKQRKDDRVVLSLDDIGGRSDLERILREFYEERIGELPWRQRARARKLCGEFLISPQGRRLRIEEAEISRLAKVPDDVLRKLVEKRLLRADRTDTGTYYELSHDTLVGPVFDQRRYWRVASLIWSIAVIASLAYGFILIFFITLYGVLNALGYSSLAKELDDASGYVLPSVGNQLAGYIVVFAIFGFLLLIIPLVVRSIFYRAKLDWTRMRHS